MMGVKARAALKPGKGTPSPIDVLLSPPEKPRGFLSFLTSPFILAHLFLVQQLFGDSIRSTLAADSTNAHESNGHDRALTEAEDQQFQPVLQTTRVDFMPQGDTVAAVQARLASETGHSLPVVFQSDSAEVPPDRQDGRPTIEWIGGGAADHVLLRYCGDLGRHHSAKLQYCNHDEGQEQIGLCDDQGPLIFDWSQEPNPYPTSALPDTAAWFLGGIALQSIIEFAVAPTHHLATEPTLAGILMPSTSTGDLASAAEPVVATATMSEMNTVAPLIDSLTTPVSTAADAIAPATDTVLAATTPVIDTVLAPAAATMDTIASAAEPVVRTEVQTVDSHTPPDSAGRHAIEPATDTGLAATTPSIYTVLAPAAATMDTIASAAAPLVSTVVPPVDSLSSPASPSSDPIAPATDTVLAATTPVIDTVLAPAAATMDTIASAAEPVV